LALATCISFQYSKKYFKYTCAHGYRQTWIHVRSVTHQLIYVAKAGFDFVFFYRLLKQTEKIRMSNIHSHCFPVFKKEIPKPSIHNDFSH